MGDRDEYKQGYRTGYQGGYDDAFYNRPGKFAEIYGRKDGQESRRDGDATIVVPGEGYLDLAFDNDSEVFDRAALNGELEKIEKPAGIANPKDFRNEVVKFTLRARANNKGRNPSWTSYEKIREVIERRMFSQVEDLLPVISFGSKKDSESEKKHDEFVQRMVERGYTERQVRRLVEWYMRVKQAS
jgi:hypothetical protein